MERALRKLGRSINAGLKRVGTQRRARRRNWEEWRATLEEFREEDAAENKRLELPAGESVHWPGFWLMEAYTPSQLPALKEGLRALGWDERADSHPTLSRFDVVAWLDRSREHGGGGWVAPAPLVARGHAGLPLFVQEVDHLPSTFREAQPRFYALTSSLTVLVMGFRLSDAAQQRLDDILRRSEEARVEARGGGGYRVTHLEEVKREALVSARSEAHAEAELWLKAQLPGIFSAGHLGGTFPACDLIITEQASPFTGDGPSPEGPERRDWRELLYFHTGWRAWESTALPGLRLALSDWPVPAPPETLTLAGRVDQVLSGTDNPVHVAGLLSDLGRRMMPFLAVRTLDPLVRGYRERLATLRDAALLRRRPLARLELLKEQFVPLTLDAQTVLRELETEGHLNAPGPGDSAAWPPLKSMSRSP